MKTWLIISILSTFVSCQDSGNGFVGLEEKVELQLPDEDEDETVIGNSAIDLSPQSYDFGPAATLSGTANQIINLRNTTTSDLYIDEFFGFDDNFTVLSNNCPTGSAALAADQSCQISIEFSPQTVGTLSSTIVIKYGTDSNNPQFNSLLPLSGSGVGQLNFDGISEITNIRHNSLRLNWESVSAATSFMVFQVNGSNINYIDTVLNTGGSTTYFDITDLTPNSTYTYRVRAVDALGNLDGNTSDVEATTIVNQPPVLDTIIAPTFYSGELISNINATDANTNSDYDQDGDKITYTCRYDNFIDGTVGSGIGECSSLVNEDSSAPSFNTDKGILSSWIPRTIDIDSNFEFEIIGTDVYGASSSTIFSGRIIPGTPDPPILTDIAPAVASNNNSPTVTGTSMASMQINLYSDSSCSTLIGSGSANTSGDWSVSASVPDDQTIRVYADAENSIGNHSNCSSNFVNYTEDSTGPTSVMLSTTPATKSSLTDISVAGFTEANVNVELFSDADCSNSLTTTTADGGGNFIGNVSVPTGVVSKIYAKSTDTAGNTGSCSVTFAQYENMVIADYIGHFVSDETENGNNTVSVASATNLNWNVKSEYDYPYFIHDKDSDSDEITIKQDGVYFFALTVPLTMISGLYRPAIKAEILVNGVPMSGAHAESSYIRYADGHVNSSLHLSLLSPSLTLGDKITVTVQMTAAHAGTEIVRLSNQASLYIEFKPNTLSLFSGESTSTTGSSNLNTSNNPFIWNNITKTTGLTHTDGTEQITLDDGGDYFVNVNVPINSTGQRASIQTQVNVNNADITGGYAMQGYIRADPGAVTPHYNSSVHWSGLVTNTIAGDNLTIKTKPEGITTSTVSVQASQYANISVEKVDTSNNHFSAYATRLVNTTNWNPNSADSIQWSELNNGIYDSNVFTHDTSSNSHEITVNQNGDYLVIYNAGYTTTVARGTPANKILLDGSPVEGAECNTSYIRATSGHNESSCSFVFLLRDISAGQKISLTSERAARSGTISIIDKALLTIIKK